MGPFRTIHWGTGAMGSRALAVALTDPRFDVVGVISERSRDRARKVLAAASERYVDSVAVGVDFDQVAETSGGADAIVLATRAHLRELEQQIVAACRKKMHVVCIGEEALHPASADGAVFHRLNDEAIRNSVAVVGTGVNPGFLMDALPLLLTAPTRRWTRLYARRVSDLSSYGETVLSGLGIGLNPFEFATARRNGSVVGHLGFAQSIAVIAERLGVDLAIIDDSAEPMVRSVTTRLANEEFSPGTVIGVLQRCTAESEDGHRVILEHPQRIGTSGEGEEPFGDLIQIEGEPSVRLRIEPGIDGGAATVALMLNIIPGLFELPPGLHSTANVPVAALARSRRLSRRGETLIATELS